MTELLIRKFIKDHDNTEDEKVRTRYGILASVIGIICNVFLCTCKIVIGLVSGLAAVEADGFNNLSDAISSLISLIGVKLAEKPADEDHPFGHGRFEYISALVVTFLILQVAISCFGTSFDKIMHPSTVNFSHITAVVLWLSVGVKIWLSLANRKMGERINSKVLLATSKDAFGDVFITLATIASLMIYMFFKINIDGFVGCVVSVIIFISGVNLAKDTIKPLLGEAIDEELYEKITGFVEGYDGIEGTHDLIVHSYGPTRKMATIHAEIRDTMSMRDAHGIVDRIERDALEKLRIRLVIHMDPVDTENEAIAECREMLTYRLGLIEPEASIHDLRMVSSGERVLVIYDLVVPYSYSEERKNQLVLRMKQETQFINDSYEANITVENSYVKK